MSKVAVIDYGMGNLHSVCKALEHVGADALIVKDPSEAIGVDRVVLPGVGSLGDCMDGLRQRKFVDWIKGWIAEDRPFLGVCLGHQALFEYSEESDSRGLGVLAGKVVQFVLPHEFKIPHMGWNAVNFKSFGTVMDKGMIEEENQFYFDHSYYVVPEDRGIVWGETTHGIEVVSAVKQGNCYAVQFHPEKSQAIGLQIYQNFLML